LNVISLTIFRYICRNKSALRVGTVKDAHSVSSFKCLKTPDFFSIRSQEKGYTGSMKTPLVILCGAALLGVGFAAGRFSAPELLQASPEPARAALLLTQNQTPNGGTPQQAPNDPRELIPLGPQPGQGQGGAQPQPQPGQGQAPEDCPVMIYQDGQLYTFPRPGQQPGQQQPGGGNGRGQQPGQGQELIPLDPGGPSGPGAPGLPAPSVPNPTPSDPARPRS
jgi:hypothetical protein